MAVRPVQSGGHSQRTHRAAGLLLSITTAAAVATTATITTINTTTTPSKITLF